MPKLLEFLKWRQRYLRIKDKTNASSEQLQEAKNRLVRVVHEIRDRTDKLFAGCITLAE